MQVILLGPPGVGKGTQAALMVKHYSLAHLATGDILRSSVANKTPLGLRVEGIMKSGALVNDEIVNQLVDEAISQIPTNMGFILDGFPRTVNQAIVLDEIFSKYNRDLTVVISFQINRSSLEARIKKRAEEDRLLGKKVRDDDNLAILKNRLVEYDLKTAPLFDFYEAKGLLRKINTDNKTIEEVFKEVQNIL